MAKKAENKACPECGADENGFSIDDLFSLGGLLDEHIDTDVSEEEMAKRLSEAYEMSKKLGGTIPGGFEDDLDELIAPKLTWQDFIRMKKTTRKQGSGKNNWSAPKRKPLAAGLFIPQKINYHVKFLLAYDCSGSMSKEQISYGISQIQALDDMGSGICVSWDSSVFWPQAVKMKNAKIGELKRAKYMGGGGTIAHPIFDEYKKEIGDVDIIVVVTDGFLSDENILRQRSAPKGVDVIWLIVGNSAFSPGFGRIFHLMNE